MTQQFSRKNKTAGTILRTAAKWTMTVAALAVGMSVSGTQPAFATDAVNAQRVLVRSDNGGSLYHYASAVSKMHKDGTRVAIQGRCESACTLYLALPPSQVCLHPGTTFSFHRAYGASATANSIGTNYMLDKYPAWVRSWIAANGGLSNQMKSMSYAYASQFVAPCTRRSAQSQIRPTTVAARHTTEYVTRAATQQQMSSFSTRSMRQRGSQASR